MKKCITKFLPMKTPEPVDPALIEAVNQHYKHDEILRQQGRIIGYAEALDDFAKGCTGRSSFALVAIEPVVRAMKTKLRELK